MSLIKNHHIAFLARLARFVSLIFILSFSTLATQISYAQQGFSNKYYECRTTGINSFALTPTGYASTSEEVCERRRIPSCRGIGGWTYGIGIFDVTKSISAAPLVLALLQPNGYHHYSVLCTGTDQRNGRPTSGQVHTTKLKYLSAEPHGCSSGQLFNPYKPTSSGYPGACKTFCTTPGYIWRPSDGECVDSNLNSSPPPVCKNCGPCNTKGNPCNPVTGNKYQPEMDFQLGDLSLTRSYNSLSPYDQGLGVGWSSNLLENISIDGTEIIVREPSGQSEMFNFDAINSTWMGDADTDLLLSESQDFTVTRQNGTQKQYDTNGKLLSVTTAGGKSTEYTYNNEGQTTQINDHFGRTITISWSLSHVDNVTDPLGNRHQYDYDVNWNLIGVTNPDRSTKTYHYENTNFPHHLTGITDENDHRYATFAFDSQGRAIRTEHADIGGGGAQEKLQFDYGLQRGQGQ